MLILRINTFCVSWKCDDVCSLLCFLIKLWDTSSSPDWTSANRPVLHCQLEGEVNLGPIQSHCLVCHSEQMVETRHHNLVDCGRRSSPLLLKRKIYFHTNTQMHTYIFIQRKRFCWKTLNIYPTNNISFEISYEKIFSSSAHSWITP